MIDIHCHVLPGIDDGAKDEAESLEFCRLAARDGIATIVATPHMRHDTFPNQPAGIRESHRRLAAALAAEGVPLRLLPGAEVHLAPDLADRYRKGEVMTYADGGRYLLLELPFHQFPAGVEETVFQLLLLGVTPVLAHPERIAFFLDDPDRLGRLIELGALTQFTASSITGTFGAETQTFCWEMLRRGWIDAVATDAHDLKYRPPLLSAASRRLAEWAGAEVAERLVREVPGRIAAGQPVQRPAPTRPALGGSRRRWSWLRRLRPRG